MATEKSTLLSNQEANPVTISNTRGILKAAIDTVAVSDGAAADIAVTGIRIPVDAKITSIVVASDAFGGSATMNVGLSSDDGGGVYTAVDADCFGTVIAVDAAVTPTEIRFETKNINTVKDRAWEIAGLSARPAYGEFVLSLAFPAETAAAGDVTVIVNFIQ